MRKTGSVVSGAAAVFLFLCGMSCAGQEPQLTNRWIEAQGSGAAGVPLLKAGSSPPTFSYEDFPGLAKRLSVDLRGMAIADVLKFLAVEGNINIAIAQDVAGTVNLLISDVTISDIFEILLSTNNLAYQVQGNVIKVISNREYKALQGVDFHDQRETVVYQLKYASALKVGTLLGNMKSDIGKIVFDDSTGCLFLSTRRRRLGRWTRSSKNRTSRR